MPPSGKSASCLYLGRSAIDFARERFLRRSQKSREELVTLEETQSAQLTARPRPDRIKIETGGGVGLAAVVLAGTV
jgi:hypothetical protein